MDIFGVLSPLVYIIDMQNPRLPRFARAESEQRFESSLTKIPLADRERFMELVGMDEQVAYASSQGWFELMDQAC